MPVFVAETGNSLNRISSIFFDFSRLKQKYLEVSDKKIKKYKSEIDQIMLKENVTDLNSTK